MGHPPGKNVRDKRREISLYAGRRIRRSECGRKSRPAPFEMTVGAVMREERAGPFEAQCKRVARKQKKVASENEVPG